MLSIELKGNLIMLVVSDAKPIFNMVSGIFLFQSYSVKQLPDWCVVVSPSKKHTSRWIRHFNAAFDLSMGSWSAFSL